MSAMVVLGDMRPGGGANVLHSALYSENKLQQLNCTSLLGGWRRTGKAYSGHRP